MRAEEEWMKSGKHPAQALGDALRQSGGHSAANAYDFHMTDMTQAGKQFAECLIRQGQGIPAREYHIPDGGLGGYVGDARCQFLLACRPVPGTALSGTEPAIAGAAAGCQQQRTVGIAMHHAGDWRKRLLVQRIFGQGVRSKFRRMRYELPPKRITRFFKQFPEMWCYLERKTASDLLQRRDVDAETPLKRLQVCN